MSNFTLKGILAAACLLTLSLGAYAQPANHVTLFSASTADATHINFTWTVPTGSPAPDGYLIKARILTSTVIVDPTSGSPIPADDSDFSGFGKGTLNVTSGAATSASFTVEADNSYEFKIYPYVGTGAGAPFFKTNGTVPTATAATTKPALTLDGTPVTSITTTGGTINYTISSTGAKPITERGVVWGTTTGVDITNTTDYTKVNGGTPLTTGGYATAISGLPNGTRIYYVAYATSSMGTKQTTEAFFDTPSTPANHVTSFAASVTDATHIRLEWIASSGTPSPEGYLILARVVPAGTITTPPATGAPNSIFNNDSNFGDNKGTLNVTSGTATSADFTVDANKSYEFKIFPYVSTIGANKPYFKIDGTVPAATASTTKPDVTLDATPIMPGSITATGATINYTIHSSGTALTERGIVWGLTPGVDITNTTDYTKVNGGTPLTTGGYATPVPSLPSGTRIYYVAYAINSLGTTETSEGSFFTLAPAPTNPMTTVTATALSGKSIRVNFPSMATLGGGATLKGYVILRRTALAPDINSVKNGVAPASLTTMGNSYVTTITGISINTYTDTGVSENTQYYYTVVPYNVNGSNDAATYNYNTTGGLKVANATTFSAGSDIIYSTIDLGNPTIPYTKNAPPPLGTIQQQPMESTNNDVHSTISLARFIVRDGGAAADADSKPTILTSITIHITNFANIHSIGLFDDHNDARYSGTDQYDISTGDITFTPNTPITILDGNSLKINVRGWMRPIVIDNQVLTISITAVTTPNDGTSSSFTADDAGGAQTLTNGAENKIDVQAGRFRLYIPESSSTPTGAGTSFDLVVDAIPADEYPSIDKDYIDAVKLTGTNGNLTGATFINQPITGGNFTGWSNISFTTGGNYTLKVSNNTATANSINDATLSFSIGSSAAEIDEVAPPPICYGSTFKPLGEIVIRETDKTGFSKGSSSGTLRTMSLVLPDGFKFKTSVTSGLIVQKKAGEAASDLSDSGNPYVYSGDDNIVTFSFNINGSANLDEIHVGGLQITATFPSNPAVLTYSGVIERLGGSAIISGDGPGEGISHGTLTAQQDSPAPSNLGFTVSALAGDQAVAPSETRFSKTVTGIKLAGTPPGTSPNFGVFSCPTPGAISRIGTAPNYEYRFIPSALAVGDYVVTYTVSAGGNDCGYSFSKTFTVYESNIDGLLTSYCSNSPASGSLTVSQSVIDGVFGTFFGQWDFVKLVYKSVDLFNNETIKDMPKNAANKYIFDPKASDFFYSILYRKKVEIGWIANNVPLNPDSDPIYSIIPVNPAPTPSIDVSAFPLTLKFCKDDAAVQLKGVPANSNDASADFFTASAQTGTVTSSGTPRMWTFSPAGATVTVNNRASIDLTYTYRDPGTGCIGTSTKVTVTIAARPASVSPLTNDELEVCQNAGAPTFTAPTITGTTYNWYSDQVLTTHAGVAGDSFTPQTTNAVAGQTTYYVTQTIDECESNRQSTASITATQVKLTVHASPGPPVTDIANAYCQGTPINANDFKISTGTAIQWYKSGTTTAITLALGSTPTTAEIQDPTKLNVSTAAVASYNFDVTQTVSNCEGAPTKVTINILPLPQLGISASGNSDKICVKGGTMTFTATDGGAPVTIAAGTGTWSGIGGLNVTSASTVTLDPSGVAPGDYPLKFQFTYNTLPPDPQCSNNKTLTVRVLPNIIPLLNPGDACEKAFVALNNESWIDFGSFNPHPNPETKIVSTRWNFGDGTDLPDGPAEDAVDDGRTKGTYNNPQHLFTSTGGVLMTYTMTTSDNCVVQATKAITVSPKPNASFVWKQACMNTASATEFQASTSPVLSISTYNWNFSRQNLLTYTPLGTGAHPTVSYTSLGKDTVQLIVATQFNCKDTVKQMVYIVPSIDPINIDNAYTQSFDGGADGWLAGGKNPSWAVGKPSGENIKTEGATNLAWDTNPAGTANTGEQSWVISPCFDFTEAEKPIISFDIWSDTPLQNDGAVLQYQDSQDGNILNDASWKVLGAVGDGAHWYNQSGISSRPGNQASNDVGWSGADGAWQHAALKLDELKGKTGVVFRIAFGANNPRRDGFAFDNIFIGERTRTVLLENFTNSSAAANTRTHNDIFRAFGNQSATEVTKVEYHTAFPGKDPINEMNTAINSSRAAFYGLSSPGTFAIDGTVATGNNASLIKVYEDRVLSPSAFRIDIMPVKVDEDVIITIKITNQTNLNMALAKANVFTVLVEKSITQQNLLGANGDPEFTYVARKMLPNAAGVALDQDIPPNGSVTLPGVVWDELTLLDPTQGAIAVFIQNTEGNDKNVFQSAIVNVDPNTVPDITTGTELPEWVGGIRVFPNPANGTDITIALPEKAKQTLPVTLIDAQGRNLLSTSIPKGNNQQTVATSTLTNGFYIVEIETGKGRFVRKKIMVMH